MFKGSFGGLFYVTNGVYDRSCSHPVALIYTPLEIGMNTVFKLMVEAMQAQTELMAQVVKTMAPADYDMTVSVFSFDDEEEFDGEDLEEGPLSEEEIAEWIDVPESTDFDLVIDIVRQVEKIYGIIDEEEWEEAEEADDEVAVEDDETEEAEEA